MRSGITTIGLIYVAYVVVALAAIVRGYGG